MNSLGYWNTPQSPPWYVLSFIGRPGNDPDEPSWTPPSASGLTAASAAATYKSWLDRTAAVILFEAGLENAQLDGQFVGQDADGPTGMIGTWELPAEFFGVGDVREAIQGSFGAEYAP